MASLWYNDFGQGFQSISAKKGTVIGAKEEAYQRRSKGYIYLCFGSVYTSHNSERPRLATTKDKLGLGLKVIHKGIKEVSREKVYWEPRKESKFKQKEAERKGNQNS